MRSAAIGFSSHKVGGQDSAQPVEEGLAVGHLRRRRPLHVGPGVLHRRLTPVLRREHGVAVLQVLDLAVDLVDEHEDPPAEVRVEGADPGENGHLRLRRRDPADEAQPAGLGLPYGLAPRRRGHDDGARPPHAPLARPGVESFEQSLAELRGPGVALVATVPGPVAGSGRDREERVDDGEPAVGREESGAVLGGALQRGDAQTVELDDVGLGELVAVPDERSGPERSTVVARPELARDRPVGRTPPGAAFEAGGVPTHDEVDGGGLVERTPSMEERGGLKGDDAVEPLPADCAQEDLADVATSGEDGGVGSGRHVSAAAYSPKLAGGEAMLDLIRSGAVLRGPRGWAHHRAHAPKVPDDGGLRQTSTPACG